MGEPREAAISLYRPVCDAKQGWRSPYWHYDFVIRGARYRSTTRETNKAQALKVENERKPLVRKGGALFVSQQPG